MINKDLEDIGFAIFEASDILKPYIHNYWVVKKNRLEKSITNKVLSDGNSGFIINFSNPYSIKIEDKNVYCHDKFTFTGPSKHPKYITFENSLDAVGVRFNAAGVYTFLQTDIFQFQDEVFGLENKHFSALDVLYEKLKMDVSIEDKIQHVEDFLVHKLKENKIKNMPWIFDFLHAIVLKKGNINLDLLCDSFNISRRTCERRFRQEVGLSPKEYSKIIRIQNAKDLINSQNTLSLVSVGYDSGFFDQSHFIREFKLYMNETPKEYFIKKQMRV